MPQDHIYLLKFFSVISHNIPAVYDVWPPGSNYLFCHDGPVSVRVVRG
jgi:hypothetical protein